MSRAAKLTLTGTSLAAVGIVVFVHWAQKAEKAVSCPNCIKKFTTTMAYDLQAMHAGVIRDIEQQRIKKERQADFDMQRALEEEYRRVQKVHDGQGDVPGGEGVGG